MKSKLKWAALGGLVLSFVSLLVHLFLAKSSADLVQYTAITLFTDDLTPNLSTRKGPWYRKLWGNVKSLEPLHPFPNPRSTYPVSVEQNNGFIYAKISGSFEKIRNSIVDLVTISRLLNATLVIPEIQESARSKGISSKFNTFSYLYNEDQFIAALANDVTIVKSLPPILREARRRKEFQIFKPKSSASLKFYTAEVLPRLKKAKVIGLILTDGGCLQSALPPSMAEYQRLRCRVSFHALQFRPEIEALGKLMDVHTELIQYRRAEMIKRGIISEELNVDSHVRKRNGSCPLMPEEVGLLLRAMGYPPRTRIYLSGSETFGGQRVMIPLRAMYTNLVDRTSLCSKTELANLVGPENPLSSDPEQLLPVKSPSQLKAEWDKAGPRPRPLPPPPDRPIYRHEKEGWYGWIAEKDMEPEPSPDDQRKQAHRLLWDALDYIVSVDAEVFFPGFHNDGSGPDFASLVMGHRLYEMASARTFRPNRKYLAELFNTTGDHLYYPPRNWTIAVREHLNKSLAEEGLLQESNLSKTKFFLSHPIPECSCSTVKATDIVRSGKNKNLHLLFEGQDECPKWMQQLRTQETNADEVDSQEDETDLDGQSESEEYNGTDAIPSLEQDEEMDPDD
ncbi:unnamed protein product [Withania somnifera]